MSSPESSLELAERLFAAFQTGGTEPVIELISDDFVLVIPPSMSAEPDSYYGPEGVRRYMDAFEGVVDDVRFSAAELYPESDHVLALVRLTGRGASSGLPVDMHAAGIIWVRDGQITGIESHPDLATAREVLARP